MRLIEENTIGILNTFVCLLLLFITKMGDLASQQMAVECLVLRITLQALPPLMGESGTGTKPCKSLDFIIITVRSSWRVLGRGVHDLTYVWEEWDDSGCWIQGRAPVRLENNVLSF